MPGTADPISQGELGYYMGRGGSQGEKGKAGPILANKTGYDPK